MSNVTPNTFERISLPITKMADDLSLSALIQLRNIQERLIRNPDTTIDTGRETQRVTNEWAGFIEESEDWTDEELAVSYLRGIEMANGSTSGVATGTFVASGLLIPATASQPISEKAEEILKDYPQHHTMYGVFKQAADNALESTRIPIVREQQGRIRDIIVESGKASYKEADVFTRRKMSQDLMTRFANEGITGIRYQDGRTMKIDSYSEMVARTQTKNAFNQANWNRLQEYGQDLTVISVHYPCSYLCEPYQGRVFSISGLSGQYPSLNSAIAGGLFHTNCKHTSSGYSPGTKAPERDRTTTENAKMYEAQKTQRYNERQIRQWKRREVSSVDPQAREKAKAKVRDWQARQRQHLDSNDFLRRDYTREKV